jgi:hypothetical protein
VLSSPAASTISSLTASSSTSVVRRQQINSSNHIIGRQQNSILNFFPKIDASRDFVKDPFRPVNIKSPELMSCEQEILDSHRTAELIQKRRKIKSLAISEGKMKKKNRIVAETILGRSVLNTILGYPLKGKETSIHGKRSWTKLITRVFQCESHMIPHKTY